MKNPYCWSPLKGDMGLNKYPLHKVYTGLIIKGTIPRGPHHFPYETETMKRNKRVTCGSTAEGMSS